MTFNEGSNIPHGKARFDAHFAHLEISLFQQSVPYEALSVEIDRDRCLRAMHSMIDQGTMRVPFLAAVAEAHDLFAFGIGAGDATGFPHAQGLFLIAPAAFADPPIVVACIPMRPPLEDGQEGHGGGLRRKKKSNAKNFFFANASCLAVLNKVFFYFMEY